MVMQRTRWVVDAAEYGVAIVLTVLSLYAVCKVRLHERMRSPLQSERWALRHMKRNTQHILVTRPHR